MYEKDEVIFEIYAELLVLDVVMESGFELVDEGCSLESIRREDVGYYIGFEFAFFVD